MLVTAYLNGSTAGSPPPPRDHSQDRKRSAVKGWTAGAVRRHTKWLYSIDSEQLDGVGIAVTLTMRDIPASSADWKNLMSRWMDRMRHNPNVTMTRIHWVVEWQRRGAPHLHCAIYFAEGTRTSWARAEAVCAWLDLTEVAYGANWKSQHSGVIDGPLGWLQYLSKHSARGVKHYQRSGMPPGWETTGRLWGHGGDWPEIAPMRFDMAAPTYHRYRRLMRAWRVAQARLEGSPHRISAARRMLRCGDPRLSYVRGVSEWAGEGITVELLALLQSEGHIMIQRAEVDG